MDNSKVIKIAASVTASTRWAIAGMMADGAQFRWANELWFEVVSALFSLAFAVVEIWATSYIMQAQHKAQANGQVERARNLLVLWVSTLVVLALALVPAMYANVIKTPISSFAPPVVIAWLACVAASTFLVIGGVGYADEAETSKPAQPIAQGPQEPQTDEIGTLDDDAGEDMPLESPHMPTGSVSSAVVVENTLPAVSPNETAQTVVLEHAPVTTADIILEYVKRNPTASKVEIAQHVARAIGGTYTRQAVDAQLKRLEVAGRIARNGHVEVLP